MSMKYRPDLDCALKNLNVKIVSRMTSYMSERLSRYLQPKHAKVGVVGRTGCGKSSTMLVMLRWVLPMLVYHH
jgi:ABC-type multidrug transport system fused ATPase/permease subunit